MYEVKVVELVYGLFSNSEDSGSQTLSGLPSANQILPTYHCARGNTMVRYRCQTRRSVDIASRSTDEDVVCKDPSS